MADSGKPDASAAAVVTHVENRSPMGRGLSLAWILFLAIGVPLGLMAVLEYVATAGIYVDFLRPFWQPWPPDLAKAFLGVAAFAVTLAYLSYRLGRSTGYRSGAVAATAVARNLAEARQPAAVPESPPEVSRPAPELPASPPQIPGQ